MPGLLELDILQLGEVLFPGMRLTLPVVEQRDRLVFDRCLERQEPCAALFAGVIPEGGAGWLRSVGTLAEIVEAERQPDGALAVTLLGVGRFRLVAVREHSQILRGQVQLLDDDGDSDACHHLAAKVVAAFAAYLAALMTLADRPVSEITMPAGCAALSYFIAASLRIKPWEQQTLLEADCTEERLRHELLIVERERGLLGKQIADTPSNPLFPESLSKN